jgi:hypothetical protein
LKSIEVAVESLPGAYVQLNALLAGGLAVDPYLLSASLLLSCASIVAITAGMDVRKDSDPVNRLMYPHFYGIVPNSGWRRMLVINMMRLMVASQLTITLLKIELIMTSCSLKILLIYMITRQFVYHSIKLIRDDWLHSLEIYGLSRLAYCFAERTLMFELASGLSWLHCRHPMEMVSDGFFCFCLEFALANTLPSLPLMPFHLSLSLYSRVVWHGV